jgi:predicted SAM-dependent methyltransferase
MKTLIGTPIHQSQSHIIEKWLENVSQLRKPTDLFMVDSSSDRNFVRTVKLYCKKYGIKNYTIEHFDYHQENGEDERIGRSREIIRKQVLTGGYEVWFNWECEFSLPVDALDKMTTVMKAGNFMVVSHSPTLKRVSVDPHVKFGCDLVRCELLKKYGFLLEYPDMPNSWYLLGLWLKKRVARDGGRCLELDISNPSHLKRFKNRNTLKLNLGCGKKHIDDYVNIDIQVPCDLKHDLTKPLPFANNSVDEIFSEGNVIALFSRKEWFNLKKEIARVLRPGGKLEIIFFDFEYITKAFLENKNNQRWEWWIETIFSGQHNEYEFSKNGFTFDKLVTDFQEDGLINFSKESTRHPGYVHFICYKKFSTTLASIMPVALLLAWENIYSVQESAFMQLFS